jgi:hypothetical protein
VTIDTLAVGCPRRVLDVSTDRRSEEGSAGRVLTTAELGG